MLSDFGQSQSGGGWISNDKYPRHLADVNGDGKAGIVGFGKASVYVALAAGGGSFGSLTFKLAEHPRRVAGEAMTVIRANSAM